MTLEISQAFVDAILEQSRVEYPDECCGVILGPAGSGKALRHKPMINAAHSPTFYEFDPKDLLAPLLPHCRWRCDRRARHNFWLKTSIRVQGDFST